MNMITRRGLLLALFVVPFVGLFGKDDLDAGVGRAWDKFVRHRKKLTKVEWERVVRNIRLCMRREFLYGDPVTIDGLIEKMEKG